MKDNYKEILPEWYKETKSFGLILTDDLDSLLGTSILKTVKNWEIEQVMLFNPFKTGIDYLGEAENATHEAIGVDFAMTEGKCFDNHLTMFTANDRYNKQSVNLNHIRRIHRGIYTQKYNLSTVLLLWSLYDLPKDDLSDELMMILLAIDSSYYSYYHGFHEANRKWLVDALDLPEFYACQERHKEYEFQDIIKKYRLKEKIKSNKGVLSTCIDIEAINDMLLWESDVQIKLPSYTFRKKATYKDIEVDIKGFPSGIDAIAENPFCYAMTRKNKVKYSERIDY